MVQFAKDDHVYSDPPPIPLLAFYIRYPNPFARHVLSVDVLSRTINPTTGRIHTTRLVLKRGILPKWASKWLPVAGASGGRGLDAWVLEDSVVEPPPTDGQGEGEASGSGIGRERDEDRDRNRWPRLRYTQGNLNHRKFMHVVEGGEIFAGPNGTTNHHTTAEIRSDFGGKWSSLIRQRIESYGAGKFEVNAETAKKGMLLIMGLIRARQPLPDTAEFYPPPPPGFSDSWTPSQSSTTNRHEDVQQDSKNFARSRRKDGAGDDEGG
ncbi:hypothetical protein BCR39DRAFT_562671 [Naematelia encephala]|uniref:PRELI/MSF1 domain-containing protein n=1 Tax=Naematelia encephala TaxID=71784 RepID=A0A1Y2AFI6_9TREE|nr:hypothetical protein BCR39DRAFT_562671 [Naematelia encephala]